jgi:branched-chain amino acid transport system ATP-binding protein
LSESTTAQTAPPILRVEDVHLHFGGIAALEGPSFEMRPGEILSIVGPNGAGKTCLVNCVTGYYRPQRGRVLYRGQDITGHPPHAIAHRGITRTFQNTALFPEMTAHQNILLARYRHTRASLAESMFFLGRARGEEIASRRAVDDLIQELGIQEIKGRLVATLSYGQRKMVEIARALATEPQVLFLDEPMSGLDDILKELVAEIIISARRRGLAVGLVEHDMPVVMGLSDAVVVLDSGVLVAAGHPDEVCRDEKVSAAYLGGTVSLAPEGGTA